MSRVRRLLAVTACGLAFVLVGTPLGTVIVLAGIAAEASKPQMFFDAFRDIGVVLWLSAMFGALPAFATGIAAGELRLHIRSMLTFAIAVALVGAITTALYECILGIILGAALWLGLIITTGGFAGFCCSFLLWRYRPWTMAPTSASAARSVVQRFRAMRDFWVGWDP